MAKKLFYIVLTIFIVGGIVGFILYYFLYQEASLDDFCKVTSTYGKCDNNTDCKTFAYVCHAKYEKDIVAHTGLLEEWGHERCRDRNCKCVRSQCRWTSK